MKLNNKIGKIMTDRVQKAIDIFLDAINEGTLAAGTCTACAVGNLVADAINCEIVIPKKNSSIGKFKNVHWMIPIAELRGIPTDFSNFEGLRQISLTGFTLEELNLIELVFERNSYIKYYNYKNYSQEEIRKDQIKGLKAVIETMLQFDEQNDNIEEVFVKKAELIPL